ncbi:membrane protein insertase YidC [Cloacibacterium normanense]|uniref:Membrane protein insertase YidC n=1 Tax=Cloacibacterium normanense TaxID=237258 RepID=A0A2S7I312_9FLAO|nr:membrane protein insertase YidC [Cloacibacterium normanense]PPZ90953.1 membrane protein insertase YidC [Cloacibacterium normanense]
MQKNNGLDKNQLISFVIFSAILMAFMFYFQNKQSDEKKVADAKAKTEQKVASKTIANNINATVNAAAIKNVTVRNKELTLEFASLGGQLSSVEINQYKAYNAKTDKHDLPLYLIEKNNSSYGFQFKDKTGKTFNTKDLVFVPSVKDNTVTMTAQVSGATIQYVYQLLDNYTLDFNVKTQGLSSIVTDEKADFHWNYTVRGMEKGRSQEQTHSEFNYAFDNYGSTDYDTNGFEEPEETLNWLAVKQQFFTSIIESSNGFTHAKGTQETIEKGQFLKKFNFDGQVKLAGNELNQNFKWYFLPLDLPLLKTFEGKEFDTILPLGWSFIGTLNRIFFVPVYNWLSDWGIAAGWVIFLMTIATKLILSPVMFKQHKLSAMMKVVKPEIEEVTEKFKGQENAMKRQQATMEIYRKAGINQMAGCLPALVQIPIFYALFRFFPNMIDLRGKGFWFANDLTAYDDLIKLPFHIPLIGEHISIFAVACTIVVLIYTIMTSGQMQQPQQEGMPDMRIIMYIFPITFFFFLNTSSSGLSWYYFVSNALNILIILAIKYWILDEKKIHAQIQQNKSKAPKPEGKFQKRMREMMEKAQEQQKMQEEQRKKMNKK